jgi:hypothetical protein
MQLRIADIFLTSHESRILYILLSASSQLLNAKRL